MSIEARLNDLELRVFDWIRLAGWSGKTTDECEAELGLTHQCCSARVSELWHKYRLIEPRGARRKTRAGRMAVIYVEAGLMAAHDRQQGDDVA